MAFVVSPKHSVMLSESKLVKGHFDLTVVRLSGDIVTTLLLPSHLEQLKQQIDIITDSVNT